MSTPFSARSRLLGNLDHQPPRCRGSDRRGRRLYYWLCRWLALGRRFAQRGRRGCSCRSIPVTVILEDGIRKGVLGNRHRQYRHRRTSWRQIGKRVRWVVAGGESVTFCPRHVSGQFLPEITVDRLADSDGNAADFDGDGVQIPEAHCEVEQPMVAEVQSEPVAPAGWITAHHQFFDAVISKPRRKMIDLGFAC